MLPKTLHARRSDRWTVEYPSAERASGMIQASNELQDWNRERKELVNRGMIWFFFSLTNVLRRNNIYMMPSSPNAFRTSRSTFTNHSS